MSSDRLREAAKAERDEWAGDVGGKFGNAAAIHIALADWLDAAADETWCCDECKFDPENGNVAGVHALTVADAILGGAA